MNAFGKVHFQGFGLATPNQIITNEQLIERFGLDVDSAWIEARTGIQSRHWLEADQTTSDIATQAAQAALLDAELLPSDIDRIILATISPDYPSPSTATIVARKLGARCAAFDVSAACAGFIYALDLAAAHLLARDEKVLVIAAEARSRFIDTSDRRGTVLFADGAAAVIVARSEQQHLLSIKLGAEGRKHMGAHRPAGGAKLPITAEVVTDGLHFLQVDAKREIFDLFVNYTREACAAVLAESQVNIADVDLFITHQGNARMVELTCEALGVNPERAINNIAHHGNTSGASVPIALVEAHQAGRIADGDLVLLTSVGAGYTFGAALWRF